MIGKKALHAMSLSELDQYARKAQAKYRFFQDRVAGFRQLEAEARKALAAHGSAAGWERLSERVNHFYALARWYSKDERNAQDRLRFIVAELRRRREALAEKAMRYSPYKLDREQKRKRA
jgi:hypothetical protein